jgi:hypothetical protein
MTDDRVRRSALTRVVLTGKDFKPGLTLTTTESTEAISGVVVSSDGTRVDFDYTPAA